MSNTEETPVIGVTANNRRYAQTYADAVERSGGRAWVILPGHDSSPEDTIGRVGGLLVCGGEDIHPSCYGEEPEPDAALELNPERDAVELPILKAALEADMPVLCICRGAQALNITMGGKLIQNVSGHSSFEQEGEDVSSYHRIYISPGSKLAATVGSGGFVRVNSRHHQGIREAQRSPRLMASAYSLEDGVIEALESPEHRWVIAVQFHPERRREIPPHFDRLFQSLVGRAREHVKPSKSP